MILINFQNVSKEYGFGESKTIALNSIDLEIAEKELVIILGPSGAGKSTILNLIGGLDKPTSGKVEVNGIDVSTLTNKQLADYRKNNIGFVFQFYNLIPLLTVSENLNVIKTLKKDSLEIDDCLKMLGLLNKKNKFPSEISGGEQQRVSIARALIKNIDILLCDEPTGALDSKTGLKILKTLKSLSADKTVIIVTHNQTISLIANRVIKVKNGLIEETYTQEPKRIEDVEW